MEERVTVPNIGDAQDVAVVEVLVQPGARVEREQPLVVLESDKASMEIPSPFAGTVKSVSVKVGDTVSEGTPLLMLDADGAGAGAEAKSNGGGAAKARGPEARPEAAPPKAAPPKAAEPAAREPEPAEAAEPAREERVTVPNLGDAHDVAVVEVLVQPGARVERDQPLVVLESDKASMEIPSPLAGTVKSVSVKVGDTVSEGTPLLILDADGAGAKAKPNDGGAAAKAKAPEAKSEEPPEAPPPRAAESHARQAEPAEPARSRTIPPIAMPQAAPSLRPPKPSDKLPHASPAIRRFGRELGVDLAAVQGSGKYGRITKDDVQNYVKHAMSVGPAPGALGLTIAEAPEIDFSKFGEITIQPLTKIQKLSGKNLHRSWVTIPHVTQFDEADITELEDFRKKMRGDQPKVKLTLVTFFMKAIVTALKDMPRFNSSLDSKGENLIVKQYFHIGVAVDTPNGLIVPVIRDVDIKSLGQLAKELEEVSERARTRKLGPTDLQGASFTISSLGGIGGTAFTPIINPPEVAVLGVSRAKWAPVYQDGQFVPRLLCPLSLSYDHRVIDGADAARFTKRLGEILADIRQMLL